MTIYFDENKEAYAQIETLNKWGKTLLYQCSDNEYKEFKDGKRIWQGNELVVNPNYEAEQAQKEAERIKQQAEADARNSLESLKMEIAKKEFELEEKKKQMQIYRIKVSSMLEAQLKILNDDDME